MKNLSAIDWIALILVLVGGLNWGLVGLADFNLVALLFGEMSFLSRVVYAILGVVFCKRTKCRNHNINYKTMEF